MFHEEVAVTLVEIIRKDHWKPEVIEAKAREIENLEKYGTFKEIEDRGQEKITSR